MRVLIVEDETIIAWELRAMVEEFGSDVVGEAATSAEAISAAGALQPDLIFMDVKLRGAGDGVDAAQQIGPLAKRVVFTTAYTDPETLERCRAVDPIGILNKPYHRSEIQRVLGEQTTRLAQKG